jgi:hypothetical protein
MDELLFLGFFGLKLRIVINDRGKPMAFKLTRGNKQDAQAGESMLHTLKETAFGDRVYISKPLFSRPLEKGLKLVTRARKNIKPIHYSKIERPLLKQRGGVETVIHHHTLPYLAY